MSSAAAAADRENPIPSPSPPSDQNQTGPTPKKPAWTRPNNGSADMAGPVMGAAWPALSESAKYPSFRASAAAADINKSVSDLSAPANVTSSSNSVTPAVLGNVGSPRTNLSNSVIPTVLSSVSSPRVGPSNSVTTAVSDNVSSLRTNSSNSVAPVELANVSSPRMSSSNSATPAVLANVSSPRTNLSNPVSSAVLANVSSPRTNSTPVVSANVSSPKMSSSNSVTPAVSANFSSPKTSSSNSITPVVSANVSSMKPNMSNSAAPAMSANVSSPKPNMSNSAAPNHALPARQKSMRRGNANNTGSVSGSSGAGSSGGEINPSPPASLGVSPRATQDQQAGPQISSQGNNSGNWDRSSRGGGSGSQFHGNNDHHRGHGGNRRGNNNGSGGIHHNNYNNNRDQERRNYDSYHHRGYSGREVHMHQWGSRPHIRPPQNAQIASPFISPVPVVQPLGNPMVYNADVPMIYVTPQQPTEPFAGLPFISYPPAHSVYFFPQIDPQRDILLKQIEYYFSNENLCKDTYFRQQMDGDGWVFASVIAGFNRVKALTDSIAFILETVASSTLLEVQGEKMRRRNDWMNWVLPASNSSTTAVSGQRIVPTPDLADLSVSLQTVGLGMPGIENMGTSAHGEVEYSRSASGNLSKQFRVVGDLNQDGNEQFTGHINTDGSQAIKSLSRSGIL